MKTLTKTARFEGGPLQITTYKTLILKPVFTSTIGAAIQPILERQEIMYKKVPAGSGHFVNKILNP